MCEVWEEEVLYEAQRKGSEGVRLFQILKPMFSSQQSEVATAVVLVPKTSTRNSPPLGATANVKLVHH